ncbi:MAG TPA: DUF6427 family protein [Bacteroidia bacterium]|nr:DUF6427 family protein [Bacteroidia bacterium]
MFAGLLNKGFRGSLLLLILLFLLAATVNYLSVQAPESYHYPDLFYNYFTREIGNKFIINSLNFLCIGLGILLVSLTISNQEIIDKQNYFPAFLYALVCIAAVNPFQISPQLFTNLFVLYALYRLFDIYRQEDVLKSIFQAAFWLSLSAYLTVASCIFFPLFFIALMILRPFHWREWAVALLGFLCTLFFYESLAYLFDWNHWFLFDSIQMYLHYLRFPTFSEYFLPLLAFLFVLLLLSLFNNFRYGFGNTVKKQRAKSVFLWMLFFDLFGFFAAGSNSSGILSLYAVPLCFLTGDFFFSIRQTKVSNTLLSLLILCVVLVVMGKLGLV